MNSTVSRSHTHTHTHSHPSSQFPLISTCKTMRDLHQVHAHFIKTSQTHDPLAAAEILRFCALSKRRDISYARKVFDQMPHPNCFSWNTLIRALAESSVDGEPSEALSLFRRMMVSGGSVEPNQFTFPSVLKACSNSGNVGMGSQVHGLAVKRGLDRDEFILSNLVRMYVLCGVMTDARLLFYRSVSQLLGNGQWRESNVVLWNVMVDGYVRAGDLRAARALFDKTPRRTVVSWNVMISGYAQNGLFVEAVELFRDMTLSGDPSPNYVTLVSVLPAISRLGALESGEWVHSYAERSGFRINDVLGSALVDMYAKCGSIERAVQVFEGIAEKESAIAWNAVIGGLAIHGRARDAIECFSRMERSGVAPTDVTYVALLSACSHGGLVEEGRSFFDRMVRVDGLEPRIEHYGCMVDLLGRSGRLEEAEEIIRNIPAGPDDVVWKALLGGCKTHRNLDVGKRAAENLMGLAPGDGGSYVALSNLYATAGDWGSVSEVRLKMKGLDVRKDPGCSWIEVNGEVNEFLAGDYESHPRAEEIRSMMNEIAEKLSSAGHRPDTSRVLLNVDEEEKPSALRSHSERIAIAYGLISTGPGDSLRIVKNLRVCEDCHASIKLISRIYGRRIVVRDRKRFHHFDDGVCSCNDFW